MSGVNIIVQQTRELVYLDHITFHRGPKGFDEKCPVCVEELQEAQADHINLEVLEQTMEVLEDESEAYD
jgi:hypothetical protein